MANESKKDFNAMMNNKKDMPKIQEELNKALIRLKESKEILQKFSTKEEAVEFLVKETEISKEECSIAYDILMKIDLEKE